jgi:TM2 domain-containing membrane protein YozV/RNA polymerase subunit RPABC4/transcription elongation factor Spt4
MSFQCNNCGTVNTDDATFCTNCGTPFAAGQMPVSNAGGLQVQQKLCVSCNRPINVTFTTCPFCGVVQPTSTGNFTPGVPVQSGTHNKTTAGLLAIFLGTVGVHKFYLGQTGMGILYLLFCWTGVPSIVALIEGIIYLTMSDAEFAQKYH